MGKLIDKFLAYAVTITVFALLIAGALAVPLLLLWSLNALGIAAGGYGIKELVAATVLLIYLLA